jgi:DNA-binding MurR/RpiR family transcriptional regulator
LASRVAQMTIIDTIYTIIALRKKESAIESFRKIEKGLESKKY